VRAGPGRCAKDISPLAGILLFLGPAGVRPDRAGPQRAGGGLAMAPQGLITGLSAALAPLGLPALRNTALAS
jgi:hypothetical protein